mmetsp:Transcript_38304/g.41527  ORF Transcript_38304/g.41527 Transcript_38304/m.41527 type:complete len:126 (+) Transcript_38304:631-1008(+)
MQSASDSSQFTARLLGLAAQHHNMDIAMGLLLKLELMTEYKDNFCENEYKIVEWIRQRIQFENEDGIEEELKELLVAGKPASKARILKINSDKNKRKNNPTNNSSGKKRKIVLDDPQHPYNDTTL